MVQLLRHWAILELVPTGHLTFIWGYCAGHSIHMTPGVRNVLLVAIRELHSVSRTGQNYVSLQFFLLMMLLLTMLLLRIVLLLLLVLVVVFVVMVVVHSPHKDVAQVNPALSL